MSAAGITMVAELRQTWRDGRTRLALLSALTLFAITLAIGAQHQTRHQRDVAAATQADRHIWEQQGARNPHSVAHFGQYAFKPSGALAIFDPGLTPWLGTALWMEAHYQNTASFRSIEDQGAPSITTTLSAAFVLQYLAPLLLIFLGYALVARERERQTLKLALANGASLPAWAGGKLFALAVLAGVLWLPVWWPVITAETDDTRIRAIGVAVVYGVYLIMLCALILTVSAYARSARSALIILLCTWVMQALVIPRVTAAVAETIAPSADTGQFWRDIRTAQQQGIDGNDPSDVRQKALLEHTLAEYGVEHEEDLPISFAGISLQASEEYSNEIFDHFYGKLQAEENKQKSVLRVASMISPWIALRRLSAGLTGNDTDHHWHFVHTAETYRRELQRYLNGDLTRNAAGVSNYQADPELWRQTAQFAYTPPHWREVGRSYWTDALMLTGWLIFSLIVLVVATRALAREGAAS